MTGGFFPTSQTLACFDICFCCQHSVILAHRILSFFYTIKIHSAHFNDKTKCYLSFLPRNLNTINVYRVFFFSFRSVSYFLHSIHSFICLFTFVSHFVLHMFQYLFNEFVAATSFRCVIMNGPYYL